MPNPTEIINFDINEFDMSRVGTNKIIVFIGMRGMGKSTLLIDYLFHNQDIPFITCISPTDDYNRTFKPHIPDCFIFDKYTPEIGANFLQRQKDISKKVMDAKAGIGDPSYKDVDPRGCLILDDCLADAKGKGSWTRDPSIMWMFMNGRHANVTLIITLQYSKGLPPDLRTNTDYVFICREPKHSNRIRLYDDWCGVLPNKDLFYEVLRTCTANYSALVVHNTSISDKIEDQIFWYRAPIHHEDFRLCYEEFWNLQKQKLASPEAMAHVQEQDKSFQPANPYAKLQPQRQRMTYAVKKVTLGEAANNAYGSAYGATYSY